jgi:hypothetical protein
VNGQTLIDFFYSGLMVYVGWSEYISYLVLIIIFTILHTISIHLSIPNCQIEFIWTNLLGFYNFIQFNLSQFSDDPIKSLTKVETKLILTYYIISSWLI